MRHTQTVELLALISQLCPSQRIDEFTPDAWHPLLTDIDLEDAVAAVYDAASAGPFVNVSDVVQGVKDMQAQRLREHPLPTPRADPDDIDAYRAEMDTNRLAVMRPHRRLEVTQ